jgi:hypothetical protein
MWPPVHFSAAGRGKTSDYNGTSNFLFGKEMLAATPAVFNELLPILKGAMHTNK